METLIALCRSTWDYLGQMAVLAVPMGLGFLLLRPWRQRRLRRLALESSTAREICLLLFVMSVGSILAVTLRPTVGWCAPLPEKTELWENLNLIPFRMFRIYGYYFRWHNFLYIIINFIGNMAVFIPIGLFPALLFRKAKWYRSTLIGCAFSVFIEVSQYFVMRQTDIDDVILNTLGALWGYWLYLLMKRLFPVFTFKFQCQKK